MKFRTVVPLLLVLAAVLPGLVKTTSAEPSTPTPPAAYTGTPPTANPQVIVYPPTPGGTCVVPEYNEPGIGHIDPDPNCPDASRPPITPGCYVFPYNKYTPCTPVPTVRPLITPTKTMSVGPPVPGPAGTTSYLVTITSAIACFSVSEPIDLYVLGDARAATVTELTPTYIPSEGIHTRVIVDPTTGMATLTLEVSNQAVGTSGITLKAVWPQEGVEALQVVIPPATTPTSTPGPGTLVLPTQVATPQPGVGIPTAIANVAPGPLSARACVTPNPVVNINPGPQTSPTPATLYVQTTPGASCVANIVFSNGQTIAGFDGGPQTALQDGFAIFPFSVNTRATEGTATVTCTLAGQSVTTETTFAIVHFLPTATPAATPTAAVTPSPTAQGAPASNSPMAACQSGPGIQAGATVSDPNPAPFTDVVVYGCITNNGGGIGGVPMFSTWHFRSGDQTCNYAVSDNRGIAACTLDIAGALSGYTVTVDVSFTYNGQTYTAETSFTPQ